jgi:NAD(P)-dependent dehydrogenase (short-subunit alcohol dehydrogenase family)
MSTSSLAGRTVVVVGASSGIGRGVAERAITSGAHVILAARRVDALSEIVDRTGGGHAVPTDLRDVESCTRLATEVSALKDPVDLLLISAGIAPLRPMARTTADDWDTALSTNLVGIHRVIVALLEHLSHSAVVAVVSSEVVDAPRSHLGAYGASKAALEHTLAQWREEYPAIRFATVSLGATVPTEFGRNFPPEDILEAFTAWTSAGRTTSAFMDTEDICDVLLATLTAVVNSPSVGMPRIEFRSPAPPETDQAAALAHAAGEPPIP